MCLTFITSSQSPTSSALIDALEMELLGDTDDSGDLRQEFQAILCICDTANGPPDCMKRRSSLSA